MQTLDNATFNKTKVSTKINDENNQFAYNKNNNININKYVDAMKMESRQSNFIVRDVRSDIIDSNEVPTLTFTAPPISVATPNSTTRPDIHGTNDNLTKYKNNNDKTS